MIVFRPRQRFSAQKMFAYSIDATSGQPGSKSSVSNHQQNPCSVEHKTNPLCAIFPIDLQDASTMRVRLPRCGRVDQLRSQRAQPLPEKIAHRFRCPSGCIGTAISGQHRGRFRRIESGHGT